MPREKISYMKPPKAKKVSAPPQVSVPPGGLPVPLGTIPARDVVASMVWTMPYHYEVQNWRMAMDAMNDVLNQDRIIQDQNETLERLRRLLGGRLPTDGTYDVSFIAGGDLVQQINEGLQAVASDIHRRASIDEARKIAISIKAEPSENSAAVKWGYEVKVSLAKAEGGGVAYIDKDGRLCPPESVTAEQVMLPLDQAGKAKAAA